MEKKDDATINDKNNFSYYSIVPGMVWVSGI